MSCLSLSEGEGRTIEGGKEKGRGNVVLRWDDRKERERGGESTTLHHSRFLSPPSFVSDFSCVMVPALSLSLMQ